MSAACVGQMALRSLHCLWQVAALTQDMPITQTWLSQIARQLADGEWAAQSALHQYLQCADSSDRYVSPPHPPLLPPPLLPPFSPPPPPSCLACHSCRANANFLCIWPVPLPSSLGHCHCAMHQLELTLVCMSCSGSQGGSFVRAQTPLLQLSRPLWFICLHASLPR